MSTDPTEYGIPVIFDVTAHSREIAGLSLVTMLAGHNIPGTDITISGVDKPTIESWWTLEAIDKEFDRNDNDAGTVVFAADLDYLHKLLVLAERHGIVAADELDTHDRLTRFLHPANRVAWGPAD